MQVSAKELRGQTKRMLEAVDRGEEVVISYRGKARARLVPIEEPAPTEQDDPLFGLWRDHDESVDVDAYVRNLRRSRF